MASEETDVSLKRPEPPVGDEFPTEIPEAKRPKIEDGQSEVTTSPVAPVQPETEVKPESIFENQESTQGLDKILNAPGVEQVAMKPDLLSTNPFDQYPPVSTSPVVQNIPPPGLGMRVPSPPMFAPPTTTLQPTAPTVAPVTHTPTFTLDPNSSEGRFVRFGEDLIQGRYDQAYQVIEEMKQTFGHDFFYWGALLLLYRYYPAIVASHLPEIPIDTTKNVLREIQNKLAPYFRSYINTLYSLISRSNSVASKALLALCFLFVGSANPHEPLGSVDDPSQGLALLSQLVASGNPLALTTSGWLHESGMYMQAKNPNKAFELFKQAAEMGYAEAQYQVGVCYDTGKVRDPREAVKYYALAAKQGNAEALYNLGVCCQSGDSLELDLNKAVEYYQLSAAQGYSRAQCNLGVCYEMEIGLPKDLSKAVYYYQLAANQGNTEALCNLGICYQDGDGVPVDLNKAVEYYQAAANQGNSEAQFNLGELYFNGDGVPKNIRKATALYMLAANSNNANAQYKLGLCYLEGEGVHMDRAQAMEYFVLASDQDHPEAQAKLAQL